MQKKWHVANQISKRGSEKSKGSEEIGQGNSGGGSFFLRHEPLNMLVTKKNKVKRGRNKLDEKTE